MHLTWNNEAKKYHSLFAETTAFLFVGLFDCPVFAPNLCLQFYRPWDIPAPQPLDGRAHCQRKSRHSWKPLMTGRPERWRRRLARSGSRFSETHHKNVHFFLLTRGKLW